MRTNEGTAKHNPVEKIARLRISSYSCPLMINDISSHCARGSTDEEEVRPHDLEIVPLDIDRSV